MSPVSSPDQESKEVTEGSTGNNAKVGVEILIGKDCGGGGWEVGVGLEETGVVSGMAWGNSPGLPLDCSSPHRVCRQNSTPPTLQSQSSTHHWLW